MPLSLGHDWDRWDTSESGRFRTVQRFGKAPSRPCRIFDQGNTVNALETLSRAEAVIDLLRVNLAGDFGAALPSNEGLTLIEARQDSGVEACELVAYLIRDARRQIADRLAGEAANAINDTPAKTPRESKPAAPPRRAAKKTKTAPIRLRSVT
jgi:hypothetical protein